LYSESDDCFVARRFDGRLRSRYIHTIATINPAIAKYVLKRNRTGTRNRMSKYLQPPERAGALG
jgi:hypothetical protein